MVNKVDVLVRLFETIEKRSKEDPSKSYTAKLLSEGKAKCIEKLKEDKPDPDFNSAMKICKKKRIGPLRPEANREIYYKKDMGILARSGFSYDISKKILSMTQKEFNQLYKLI